MTAIRQISWPKLPPASQPSTVDSTKKVARIIQARQPLPVITTVPKSATATAMQAAQSSSSAAIRERQRGQGSAARPGQPEPLAGISCGTALVVTRRG